VPLNSSTQFTVKYICSNNNEIDKVAYMPIVLESRKEHYDEGGWLNFSRGQISTL